MNIDNNKLNIENAYMDLVRKSLQNLSLKGLSEGEAGGSIVVISDLVSSDTTDSKMSNLLTLTCRTKIVLPDEYNEHNRIILTLDARTHPSGESIGETATSVNLYVTTNTKYDREVVIDQVAARALGLDRLVDSYRRDFSVSFAKRNNRKEKLRIKKILDVNYYKTDIWSVVERVMFDQHKALHLVKRHIDNLYKN